MTTTTTTAADPHAHIWAENARIHDLRLAMCAWRTDPVNGRARLVKDIARQYAASDREIARALGRVSGRFPSSPLVYKDFDAYVAAAPPGATRSSRRSARTGPRPIASSACCSTASATRRASSG